MKNGRFIYLSFILILLAAGCGYQETLTEASLSAAYTPDPEFTPLTQRLGIYAGSAIGSTFYIEGISYQYTSNVLMVHDPQAALQDQYRLESLAMYWDLTEPTVPDPQDSGQIYVNGHLIWDEAQILYVQLGADLMGKPLTEVHYNPLYSRYEQYFEKMGVYRQENEPYGEVSILPYGAWTCAQQCSPEFGDSSSPPDFPDRATEEPMKQAEAAFWDTVAQLGIQFSGYPLTAAYLAQDGLVEKVFENVVMVWDPAQNGAVYLRNLPQAVGITPTPLVAPIPGMHYFLISGDLGYNLSQDFMVYVSRHGTLAFIGQPISEMHARTTGITRQCFEKVCLLYDQNAPAALRIRPEALGYQYLNANYPTDHNLVPQEAVLPSQISPSSKVSLTIRKEADFISQDEAQTIIAGVFDGQKPMIGAAIVVTVTLPDGSQRSYSMPLTGEDGQAQIELDPILAEKGTIILYQVCITNLPESQFCRNDEYIIWDE